MLFKGIFKILICTGREIRTPINGFGDRYSAIELCPYKAKSYSDRSKQLLVILYKEIHRLQDSLPARSYKPVARRLLLFYDLCNLTSTHSTTPFSNSELQSSFQCD